MGAGSSSNPIPTALSTWTFSASNALSTASRWPASTHGPYAAYFNARHASSGHVWQGRYYSCPLDEPHFWAALRYTELNPVRAGMVAEPETYA